MPDYRRSRLRGGTFFFTVVTYRRRRILTDPFCRDALRDSISEARRIQPFAIDAWVLLPDHLHCIWTLPSTDNNFSKRWGLIKAGFTKRLPDSIKKPRTTGPSRIGRRESVVWQRRFWEHQIRNTADLRRHLDYIHYNPVKHGLVANAREWPFSTFHRYVKEGFYSANWGESENSEGFEFGEPK